MNSFPPLCCSIVQWGLLSIRLAKRFFALREIGVIVAGCMDLDLDVCNLVDVPVLVENECATMRSGTSRRVSRTGSRLRLEHYLDEIH
jgi:hypothetical protein